MISLDHYLAAACEGGRYALSLKLILIESLVVTPMVRLQSLSFPTFPRIPFFATNESFLEVFHHIF